MFTTWTIARSVTTDRRDQALIQTFGWWQDICLLRQAGVPAYCPLALRPLPLDAIMGCKVC